MIHLSPMQEFAQMLQMAMSAIEIHQPHAESYRFEFGDYTVTLKKNKKLVKIARQLRQKRQ